MENNDEQAKQPQQQQQQHESKQLSFEELQQLQVNSDHAFAIALQEQFFKVIEKTAPVAFYTLEKGSSAAGLNVSVIRDSGSREFYMEGGAMVLADGGVVYIDEFDKIRAEDSWDQSAYCTCSG